MGLIESPKFSQVHTRLFEGWRTFIPDGEVSWKPIEFSLKPFEIILSNGVITDLVIDKEVSNWESNMIKGIMSQFQLDLKGSRRIDSELDGSEGGLPSVFKTMEETVTGNTETMYEINELPEYLLQDEEFDYLKDRQGGVLEVVKHKNYSNYVELPSYAFGFGDLEYEIPASNRMGAFFVRSSFTRAILSGNMDKNTVQNSFTVNKIVANPTLSDQQKVCSIGMVVSTMNVTLESFGAPKDSIQDVQNPVHVGNLVYSYESPYSKSSLVHQKSPYQHRQQFDIDLERRLRASNMGKDKRVTKDKEMRKRLRRSIEQLGGSLMEEGDFSQSEENYLNRKPELNQAPESPMLPYTMAFKGLSVKKGVDVVKTVQKIAMEIGSDLQNPPKVANENTLNKFTILTSLIRVMSEEELTQAATRLFTQSVGDERSYAWQAFRDAVAESGTGPALLTIQNWILTKKVGSTEGSQIIYAMLQSVRQPTEDYMRSSFEFIKKPEILGQWPLNDTALLSYTDLVRRVYINKRNSEKEFPVRSFGHFRTEKGKTFVAEEVIPHLSQKLQEAISNADTYQIHTYIRSIGNIGHPLIFRAYEPYLEGKKQVSQFQRLLMIMSMDKVAELYPTETRSVLFKIYQNIGETQEIRVAAVYRLMYTRPPVDMLQLMASYTNVDKHEHVNAAVKAIILEAAQLEGSAPHHFEIRRAAQAAVPLLTTAEYGQQHGGAFLRHYFYHHLNVMYSEEYSTFGAEESFQAHGYKYSLNANLNGLYRKVFSVQKMVSNLQELFHVGMMQTDSYQKQQERQKQASEEQMKNPWSSIRIARLMKISNEEREQLEGNLLLQFEQLYQTLPFDNMTIENIPQVVKEWEEELKAGKKIDYVKFVNSRDLALSFPTEMGFPFLYTYDTPIVIKLEGDLKFESQPQLSKDGKLYTPDTLSLISEMAFTYGSKTQGRLSFYTPFDHQQYFAGFDKHMHIHVPLHGKLQYDVKNMQVKAEIIPKEVHQGAYLFHYSTWPYTSYVDIMSFKPLAHQPSTHIIKRHSIKNWEQTFGKRQTGLAFHLKVEHEREFITSHHLFDLMKEGMFKREVNWNQLYTIYRGIQLSGSLSNLLSDVWSNGAIQYSRIDVSYLPEESTVSKYVVHIGHQHRYHKEGPVSENSANADLTTQVMLGSGSPLERQQKVMDRVSQGIKSVKAMVMEMSVEFQGDITRKYLLIGGLGKSNVDPISRLFLHYHKSADSAEFKPYELTLEGRNDIPNTNALDLLYTMKAEPKVDSHMTLRFGSPHQAMSKIDGFFEFRRSEERKQYLKHLPNYLQCINDMGKGNKQSQTCVNITMEANLLDRVKVKLSYDNLKPDIIDTLRAFFEAARVNYFFNVETQRGQSSGGVSGQENRISIQGRFDPDLKFLNVSVREHDRETTFTNFRIGQYLKEIMVLHPVFHLKSRVMSKAMGLDLYRPTCVVDRRNTFTFNNFSYPMDLQSRWTVMFQYVPKDARHGDRQQPVQETLMYSPENYAILVRAGQDKNNKEVLMTISSPETEYRVTEIKLLPYGGDQDGVKAKVYFDGQEIQVSDKQSFDIHGDHIQIYSLPNGEVKVEVKGRYYIIYDGQTIRLNPLSDMFRDSVRGLCGQFNDERAEELMTAPNCIARDPLKFVKSFEAEGQEGEQMRNLLSQSTHECVELRTPYRYGDVISDLSAWRKRGSMYSESRPYPLGQCSSFQTRYIEQDSQICFTTRAMPVCSSGCVAHGSMTKEVPVHCITKSNVAQLWKSQIDKGASPDFSHKKPTKTVSIDLPQSCTY
ncbi:unnamed protein product [Acanthoscelides obtectus]|uniref:Vitellogenin n=1 Tax=Acanthoscelides obtectus TaxID=200917 RepID=A0A9P0LXL4_ACAOB|nr:unnamed protein product [Acanthoscelides obtectus]CAK1627650.1 Vitellogenin [Acanthoscelides obtectus]